MKIIKMEKEKLDSLPLLKVNGFHSESNLHIYNNGVLKVFTRSYALEKKEETIDFLDYHRQEINSKLHEILLPREKIITEDGFVGYGMKYVNGVSLEKYFDNDDISFSKKKEMLVKVGKFIDKLNEVREGNPDLNHFFINDLHAGNIMVINDDIKFIDVDSFMTSNEYYYPSLYLSMLAPTYLKGLSKYKVDVNNVIPNNSTDLYCYLMMATKLLTGYSLSGRSMYSYSSYMTYFKSLGLPKEYIDCLKSIFEDGPTINPSDAINKVKKIQLKRQK